MMYSLSPIHPIKGGKDNPSSLLPLNKGRLGGVNIPSILVGEVGIDSYRG